MVNIVYAVEFNDLVSFVLGLWAGKRRKNKMI